MEVYNSLVLDSMKSDASWAEKWLYPLLDAIGTYHRQGHNFESWLSEILKNQPKLIWHLEKWFDVDSRSCHRLTVYISAVQVCRKLGLLSSPKLTSDEVVDPNLWNNTVKMSVIQQALEHNDPKVRMMNFNLISFLFVLMQVLSFFGFCSIDIWKDFFLWSWVILTILLFFSLITFNIMDLLIIKMFFKI